MGSRHSKPSLFCGLSANGDEVESSIFLSKFFGKNCWATELKKVISRKVDLKTQNTKDYSPTCFRLANDYSNKFRDRRGRDCSPPCEKCG